MERGRKPPSSRSERLKYESSPTLLGDGYCSCLPEASYRSMFQWFRRSLGWNGPYAWFRFCPDRKPSALYPAAAQCRVGARRGIFLPEALSASCFSGRRPWKAKRENRKLAQGKITKQTRTVSKGGQTCFSIADARITRQTAQPTIPTVPTNRRCHRQLVVALVCLNICLSPGIFIVWMQGRAAGSLASSRC